MAAPGPRLHPARPLHPSRRALRRHAAAHCPRGRAGDRAGRGLARSGIALPVAVNIYTTDLIGDELVADIATMLERHRLDPSMLLLDTTERMATNQVEEATRTLNALREMGVCISLDDFGTGYSSLARLITLPVDEIKIDRVFVAAMSDNDSAVSIVRALIDLAHALQLPAIAEGVEESDQWRLLAQLGCDGVQGWHIARPMPAREATEWLRARLSVAPPEPLTTVPEPAAVETRVAEPDPVAASVG